MFDLEKLKADPSSASADDVLELIRLLELARGELPNYASGIAAELDGSIGEIKSIARQ